MKTQLSSAAERNVTRAEDLRSSSRKMTFSSFSYLFILVVLNFSEAHSYLPGDSADVAMCVTGHYRTMFHPAVMAAHLAAFEHLPRLKLFGEVEVQGGGQADLAYRINPKQFEIKYAHDISQYNFSSFRIMDQDSTFVQELFKTGNCDEGGSCANKWTKRLMSHRAGKPMRSSSGRFRSAPD